MPGMARIFGRMSLAISAVVRVRSLHGFMMMAEKPASGVGLPALTKYRDVSGMLRYTLSKAGRYSAVYSTVEPSGAVNAPKITPRSSIGASSDLRLRNSGTEMPANRSQINPAIQRRSSEAANVRRYDSVSQVNARSIALYSAPCLVSCRNSFEHIIGESVSAIKPDTTTAPASASANSINKRSVRV